MGCAEEMKTGDLFGMYLRIEMGFFLNISQSCFEFGNYLEMPGN